MYQPKHHEENRIEVLHGLMKSYPFGTIASLGHEGLLVNHMPFLLDPGSGEFGTLRCHVARANPVWQQFSDSVESIVIFQGPDAYVSPSWYPGKHEHGKAVPTWNYAVVHAHGLPRVINDAAWLLDHVTELSNTHEASQRLPWKVSDAPPDYIERMLEMIVGVEMPITSLVGKWKVSQNRPAADRDGVAAGLESRKDEQSRAMAALVRDAMHK
ncbi:FMN-binding negative transcriptional regulator [soil metagenome]